MAVSNNLGLYLPTREDYISVTRDISDNMSILDAAAGQLDIIINGNTASVNVITGQYVTLINSTITGATDGLYKASSNVSAGVAFTSSNLTPVTSGALNELNNRIDNLSIIPQKIINATTTTISKTLTVSKSGRYKIDFITNSINAMFSINVTTTTTGVAAIQELAKGSEITFDTSVAERLTINFSTSRGGYFFVQSATNSLLDAVTLI